MNKNYDYYNDLASTMWTTDKKKKTVDGEILEFIDDKDLDSFNENDLHGKDINGPWGTKKNNERIKVWLLSFGKLMVSPLE